MTDTERLRSILKRVRYPGMAFEVSPNGTWMRVVFMAADNEVPGAEQVRWGRRWLVDEHATDGEIVQTALKAILTALEHEAREKFTFDGARVFSPHFDIYRLADCARLDVNLGPRLGPRLNQAEPAPDTGAAVGPGAKSAPAAPADPDDAMLGMLMSRMGQLADGDPSIDADRIGEVAHLISAILIRKKLGQ